MIMAQAERVSSFESKHYKMQESHAQKLQTLFTASGSLIQCKFHDLNSRAKVSFAVL